MFKKIQELESQIESLWSKIKDKIEKRIPDANAENIDENHDAIREVTIGMPFSAK